MMNGLLFVVSAPSGAGKTSLLKALVPSDPRLALSVSHTTRSMRPGEEDGVHYHFVSVEQFQALAAQGGFLEQAQVFDNYYGTAEEVLHSQMSAGQDLVLEIDWQGGRQVRRRFPDAISIFIAPPSIEALEQRLGGRGQDDASIIQRRMRDAVEELSHYPEYDYLVMNDDFEQALSELESIVKAERLRMNRNATVHAQALRGMLSPGVAEND
jgi:guanylate kinase